MYTHEPLSAPKLTLFSFPWATKQEQASQYLGTVLTRILQVIDVR